MIYSRSAKEWIERLDTDKSGCLNENELQSGLDTFFGVRQTTQESKPLKADTKVKED